MNQELIDRCPFREKTASRRLFLTIARSEEPMTKAEVARAAHLTVAKTATLLAAYVNPMHKAPLDRVGVRLVRSKDGGYTLESCKPKPNAKRPPRGATKTAAKKAQKRTHLAKVRKEPLSTTETVPAGKSPRKKRAKRPAAEAETPGEPQPIPPPMVSEASPANDATN